MEKRLRDEDKRVEPDDLVFMTISPQDFDFYVEALRLIQPTHVVLDPDKGIRPGRVLMSRIRADRLAAGEE